MITLREDIFHSFIGSSSTVGNFRSIFEQDFDEFSNAFSLHRMYFSNIRLKIKESNRFFCKKKTNLEQV